MLENINDYLQLFALIVLFVVMLFLLIRAVNVQVIAYRVRKEREYYTKGSKKERI